MVLVASLLSLVVLTLTTPSHPSHQCDVVILRALVTFHTVPVKKKCVCNNIVEYAASVGAGSHAAHGGNHRLMPETIPYCCC
mmetsp:Transcript_13275/g.33929  ORF Transcript_13275/g.33929 Transcript_13275/m.33929 type:complete len:82 (+) Transcript_13275:231-476(+)